MKISYIYKKYLDLSHGSLDPIPNKPANQWSKYYDSKYKIPLEPVIHFEGNSFESLSAYLFCIYGSPLWGVHNRNLPDFPFIRRFRRPVPSGGALYPNELYLWIGSKWGVEAGIYHYNPFSHELSLVRMGDFRSYMEKALFYRTQITENDIVVWITVMLDKNSHKYGGLSYRIQSLDSGVTLQRMEDVAEIWGKTANIFLQFHDKEVEELLDIDYHEGVVGCCIIRSSYTTSRGSKKYDLGGEFCLNRDRRSLVRDVWFGEYPRQTTSPYFKELCMLHRAGYTSTPYNSAKKINNSISHHSQLYYLLPKPKTIPNIPIDEYLYNRYTSFHFFDDRPIPIQLFSSYLYGVMSMLRKNQWKDRLPVLLYCYCHNVETIEKGIYLYDNEQHKLLCIHQGDMANKIKGSIIQPDLIMTNVGVTFFIVGDHQNAFDHYHERGYRILNIVGGSILELLNHYAILCNLARYPFLAFNVNSIKNILGISNGMFPLVMFFLGYERRNFVRIVFPMYV